MDRAFLQHWPRENSDLFRYTVQSIFPSIPFRFASDPACSVPAVFPQVSNITETKKNSLLSSSSDTTSWNNPFLVNEKTTRFSSQIQCSTCYFLCFNQFRMWKAAGGRAGKGEEMRPAGLSGLARTALASFTAAHSGAQHRLQLECGMNRIPYFVCTHSPSQFTAFLLVSFKNPHATSCQCSYLGFHYVLILFYPSP